MNVELLRKIQQRILDSPRNFDMSSWTSTIWDDNDQPCGSTCCIAGEALMLAGARNKGNHFYNTPELSAKLACLNLPVPEPNGWIEPRETASELLGIDYDQAKRLFHVENWPEEFGNKFYDKSVEKQASIAVERIDHFIATGGKE